MNTNVKLPEKLSDLLELAVRDAQACEKDPRYALDMATWYDSTTGEKCRVCMAGAVLAQTLGVGPDGPWGAWPDDDAASTALQAIDDLRTGFTPPGHSADANRISLVLAPFRKKYNAGHPDSHLPWSDYLDMARALREAGF